MSGTVPDAPVVIDVQGLEKTFRVPTHRVDSLKERVTRPLTRIEYRELRALQDISFDVRKGEFFGIVGRNGSGKSTLLKVLASIYRASGGRIRMAGRLAPFIELGVGFNPDLTARENVTLNGVMMGLGRREARNRLDAVLDFADLRDFAELRLKNYSSGMMVRLAFATMVQADADVMLIDEVLAVGDAAFAQKCVDVFYERRRAGKTVVLVTHDMSAVQAFCHRAMLLHDGEQLYIGEPEEAAMQYFRLNFAESVPAGDTGLQSVPDVNATLIEGGLEDEAGEPVANVEQSAPLHVNVLVEARRELEQPVFGLHFMTSEGVEVFGTNHTLGGEGAPTRVRPGERLRVRGTIDNPLLPGRYFVNLWIGRSRSEREVALQVLRLTDFVVYGTRPGPGLVSAAGELTAVVEPS